MPRFHIESSQIQEGLVVLSSRESRHALSVLRLKTGDAVELFDGKGALYSGIVTEDKKGRVTVRVNRNSGQASESSVPIALAVSVIKPEPMDLLIQKACEIGAHSIYPLITERCVVRLSAERWASKAERWRKIALESCKQCGRAQTPEIHAVQDFKRFLAGPFRSQGLALIPTLAKKGKRMYDILTSQTPRKLLILIGPEGDFTEKEVEMALSGGAEPVDLGPRILRSETAALYALSVAQFVMNEVQNASK